MHSIRNSFLLLSYNPRPIRELFALGKLLGIYLTKDSIINNFHKVFGYRNENLAIRFYNLLSEGFNGVHIYLPNYCIKLQGLVDGYPMQLNIFGFRMLDSKKTGEVWAEDISDILVNALSHCPNSQKDLTYTDLVG